jgi:hypothetical protein
MMCVHQRRAGVRRLRRWASTIARAQVRRPPFGHGNAAPHALPSTPSWLPDTALVADVAVVRARLEGGARFTGHRLHRGRHLVAADTDVARVAGMLVDAGLTGVACNEGVAGVA